MFSFCFFPSSPLSPPIGTRFLFSSSGFELLFEFLFSYRFFRVVFYRSFSDSFLDPFVCPIFPIFFPTSHILHFFTDSFEHMLPYVLTFSLFSPTHICSVTYLQFIIFWPAGCPPYRSASPLNALAPTNQYNGTTDDVACRALCLRPPPGAGAGAGCRQPYLGRGVGNYYPSLVIKFGTICRQINGLFKNNI